MDKLAKGTLEVEKVEVEMEEVKKKQELKEQSYSNKVESV